MEKPNEILQLEKKYGIIIEHTNNIIEIIDKDENKYFLYDSGEIMGLNLSNNDFIEIPDLKEMKSLFVLNLSRNKIRNIENLNGLHNLSELYLRYNKISEIKNLDYLRNLKILDFYDNKISKIENINHLKSLWRLDLGFNDIKEIENLEGCQNLYELRLAANHITEIKNLDSLKKLSILSINSNKITEINNLDSLKKLSNLSLSYNQIKEVKNLKFFQKEVSLHLAGNQITDLKFLNELKNIRAMTVSRNLIADIQELQILGNYKKLKYLNIDKNPFLEGLNIKLKEFENHLDTIKNELQKLKRHKRNIILPVKIMLLGNHASGKSTFLEYFLTNKIINRNDSTHILKIITKPKITIRSKNLPQIIFYDFGGQDYYHGVYQAFLSLDTINLIFWHSYEDVYKNQNEKIE